PYQPPEMQLTKEQLQKIASETDLGILTIGRNAGEGGDRFEVNDFLLSDIEVAMIKNACEVFHEVGKKVVVVLNIGGVIETASWKALPDAILLAWQGGQEGGNSVADILGGKVNPSGKLPMTFPLTLNDHASNANFPTEGGHFGIEDIFGMMFFGPPQRPEAEQVRNRDYTNYEEGVYVGYRHFDKTELAVSYPFGYGLSYTSFELSELNTEVVNDTIQLTVNIKNIGNLSGKEVVQVYASKVEASIDRPIQELKAFRKTSELAPGIAETINIQIPVKELSYWDEAPAQWQLEQGKYNIKVAPSSRAEGLQQLILLE
ncbi:MAG: glycoside hydrolase family 3 C-terminal domain-containing protein, partial [Bacteroidota bacterium]